MKARPYAVSPGTSRLLYISQSYPPQRDAVGMLSPNLIPAKSLERCVCPPYPGDLICPSFLPFPSLGQTRFGSIERYRFDCDVAKRPRHCRLFAVAGPATYGCVR